MTEYSENVKKVREQLVGIMQDKELKGVLELLADIIKETRMRSDHLSGLHFEVKRFIPEDTQYDENYWMAAFFLYLNGPQVIKLYKELEAIEEEIIIVNEYLQRLEGELLASEAAIQALHEYVEKLSSLSRKLSEKTNALYEKLNSMKKSSDRILYDSIRRRYHFLDDTLHAITDRIEEAYTEIEKGDKHIGRLKEEYEYAIRHLRELERDRAHIVDLIRDFVDSVEES
jgi:uncharacterized coiled-coil protein SlyX